MKKLLELVHTSGADNWSARCKEAFDELFGATTGRYPARAKESYQLRAPDMKGDDTVPFCALIHPSNPTSGMYGGMSFVLFPIEDGPCLLGLGVGTQGLSPDESILGRPGHSRKVKAITNLLNRRHGQGNVIAWAKQEPTRIDIQAPENVARAFAAHERVFRRYGNVMYGVFSPTEDQNETEYALKAYLDLYFEERGFEPLKVAKDESDTIKKDYYSHLLPDLSRATVFDVLKHRKFAILEGPPGTGKTRMASEMIDDEYGGNGQSIQFHPNTTYEQFIGGLAPQSSGSGFGFHFVPTPGALMNAASEAAKDKSKPYLLHIDEINRSDLAKVLGEAIFLLEFRDEKRSITLPFDFGSGRKFSLPPNLHIVGTMNSADRSIAILDVAIRRRFAFLRLWPQMDVVSEFGGSLMNDAFRGLVDVFVEHASDDAFNLLPGHSYFLETDNSLAAESLKINLLPLLEEYLAEGYLTGFADGIRAYCQWIESL